MTRNRQVPGRIISARDRRKIVRAVDTGSTRAAVQARFGITPDVLARVLAEAGHD